MAKRRWKKYGNYSSNAGSSDGDAGGLVATIVMLGCCYLGLLAFKSDKSDFYKALIISVLVIAACFALAISWLFFKVRRLKKKYDRIRYEIKKHNLEEEVINFIRSWGNNREKGTAVQHIKNYVFNKERLDYFFDYLSKEKGIPIPRHLLDKVLEAYIDEIERKVTVGGVKNVAQVFSTLSGDDFEKLVGRLYAAMGYDVRPIGGTGDQGGDLVISRTGERILVQAKRYTGSVGNAAVQQAFTAKPIYNCASAMVVSTSLYTREAVEAALLTGVKLIDKGTLQQLLLEHLKESWN